MGLSGEAALFLRFSKNRWRRESVEDMRKKVASELNLPLLCVKLLHPDGTLIPLEGGQIKLAALKLRQVVPDSTV